MDRDIKPIDIKYGQSLKTGNLYCMYAVSSHGFPNPNDFKLDERNLEFGSHCLMIKQPGVFLKKVSSALKKRGLKFRHGFVEYYEKKPIIRDLSPFDKSNEYEYQKEFRFFVENEKNEPLKINIGSMKSFTEIYEAKDLTTLELKVK